MGKLVCVSNRISIPRRGVAAGGLAVGLLSALRNTGGTWFGWSGATVEEPAAEPEILVRDNIRFATIDLNPAEFDAYYNGYCNSTLWPLFHYFPQRFRHDEAQQAAYQSVNARFAQQLLSLLEPDDIVWVHDYHLIPLAKYLREGNFKGSIGYFLHIPFPHAQMLRLLPGHAELLRDLCQYDLIGLQTQDDVGSFHSCLEFTGLEDEAPRVGAYPIGVDVAGIAAEAQAAVQEETLERLTSSLLGRKLIIGIDRLDYSKGLIERFAAFELFLQTYPENLENVTFLQIAPLSRPDVLAYSEIRGALEQMAGRLNGRFAAADWTPIRYLNRNFSHATSMGFLRAAKVALVTPVRDGMNLVAKEFVAAQDPEDPGVLVLSPMAGAARELTGAVQVNPYDRRGMAMALQTALHMPLEERKRRHKKMFAAVQRNDIHQWYSRFVRDLSGKPRSASKARGLRIERPRSGRLDA